MNKCISLYKICRFFVCAGKSAAVGISRARRQHSNLFLRRCGARQFAIKKYGKNFSKRYAHFCVGQNANGV